MTYRLIWVLIVLTALLVRFEDVLAAGPRPYNKSVKVKKHIVRLSPEEQIVYDDCKLMWPKNVYMRGRCFKWHSNAMNHFTNLMVEMSHSGNTSIESPKLTDEEVILRRCLWKYSTTEYIDWLLVDKCGTDNLMYYQKHNRREYVPPRKE